jgi:hydroxymethylbilane synthase
MMNMFIGEKTMFSKVYRIGTRGSPLALVQTNIVIQQLQVVCPSLIFQVVPIKTTGDIITDQSLADIGGKALFAKEIEQALINEEIDFAVHSLKDLETSLPEALQIGCVLAREEPFDVLISHNSLSISGLTKGATVGTCSPRRAAQLCFHQPDLNIVTMRGNVGTRLNKLVKGDVDAIILALAGLKRLGIWENSTIKGYNDLQAVVLSVDEMLPAVGQGALAIECRRNDDDVKSLLQKINDPVTEICTRAERAMLAELGGDCRTPVGGYSVFKNERELELSGMINLYHEKATGTPDDPEALGREVANLLKKKF